MVLASGDSWLLINNEDCCKSATNLMKFSYLIQFLKKKKMGSTNNLKCTRNDEIAPRRGLIPLSLIRIFLIGWRTTAKKILPPPKQIPWQYVFLFDIWLIWLKRILTVFRNKATQLTLGIEIMNKSSEYVLCALSPKNPPRQINKLVRRDITK